jgi:type I restriction enzyme S subunit
MIDVSPFQLDTIKKILQKHVPECEVRAFGSRATWTAKDYSDLDLAVVGKAKLSNKVLYALKDDFKESDLSFRVDVLDWNAISKEFRQVIEKKYEVIQKAEGSLSVARDGWKKYKLSQIMDIIGGGTPKTTVAEYWNGDIPWLSVVDFGGGNRWVYDTEKKITAKGLNESSTKILKKGQVIISARGTVGVVAQLGRDMAFNQSCYGLDGDPALVSNDFLYYLIKFHVNALKQNTHGAVFDTITRQTFDCINVDLAPLPEQLKIAKVLSDLDAKIEINQQMNKTLEDMAQALFKEWFLDFKFPGHEKAKFINGLPEGWEKKPIAECGQVICGKTPPTANKENYGGDISFITIPDMRGNPFVIKTDRCISFKGASTQKNKELPPYSICVSCIATPGLVSMTSEVSHTNQQINSIIPKKDISPFFVYCALLNKSEDIKTMGQGGTATLNLNTGDFARIQIAVPTDIILNEFHTTVASLFEMILVSAKESLHLCSIRDSILSRLMAGEVTA